MSKPNTLIPPLQMPSAGLRTCKASVVGFLASSETLTGITITAPVGFTVTSAAVIGTETTIRGKIVPASQSVQFKVRAPAVLVRTVYQFRLDLTTSAGNEPDCYVDVIVDVK